MSWYIQKSILPFGFIFLYGSGFIFAQYGLVHSSPMIFLAIRFFITFLILLLITYILKASFPKTKKEFFQIAIAGSLTVGVFSGGAIQTFSSTILVLPFLFFEDIKIDWNIEFSIALFYMAIGVSIGALSLLYIMIKNGEVSKVSSIFYLVPVSAVIVSYFLLNETMDWSVLVGIVTVIIGITLINKKEKK